MMRALAGCWCLAVLLGLCSCQKCESETAKSEQALILASNPAAFEQNQTKDLSGSITGTVVVSNPAALFAKLEKLGGAVAQIPPGSLSALLFQQMVMVGFIDPDVLDLAQPVGWLLLDPATLGKSFVICVGVKSEESFWKALEPSWKRRDVQEGIAEILFQAEEGTKAQEGKESLPAFAHPWYLTFSNNHMFIAPKPEGLKAGSKVLLERVRAAGNRPGILAKTRFAPWRGMLSEEMIAPLRQMLDPKKAGSADSQGPMEPSRLNLWLVGWLSDRLDSFLTQINELSVELTASDDGLVLQVSMTPEKDSFFSKLLAGQKPGTLVHFQDLLPPMGFVMLDGNVQLRLLLEGFGDFYQEMLKAIGATQGQSLREMIAQWAEVMGDEVAVVEGLDQDGFTMVGVIAVQDEKAALRLMQQSLSWADALVRDTKTRSSVGKVLAGYVPKEFGDHNGVRVMGMEIRTDTSALPPAQAQMQKRMFGDQQLLAWAAFDRKMVMAVGRKAPQQVRAVLDRAKEGLPGFSSWAPYQKASRGDSKGDGGHLYFSVSQSLSSSLQLSYQALGEKSLPWKIPDPVSGILVRFDSTPERFHLALNFPLDHLQEIGNLFKLMMQASSAPSQ